MSINLMKTYRNNSKRRATRREWKLRLNIARKILNKTRAKLNQEDAESSAELVGNHIEVFSREDGNLSSQQQSDSSVVDSVLEITNTENAVVEVGDTISETSDVVESSCTNTLSHNDSEDELSDLSTDSNEISLSNCENEKQTVYEPQYLYQGSNVTKHEFSVALLSIAHKHSITNSCVQDVLNLVSQVLPMDKQNFLPQSRHILIRNVISYTDSTSIHKCCGYCTRLLSTKSSCTSPECIKAGLPESSFIEVHIDKQLQRLFSDDKFVQCLKYRFDRQGSSDTIGDIYDGTIYKEQSAFFKNPCNISFNLNYDGAPIFKSNNMQVWPVQLSINELPPLLRRSKNYMLLAGLWCSTQKPPSFTFLEPLLTTLGNMESVGTQVVVAGENQTVRARLICSVMDLPAKALMLNCNQFNGAYGCAACKDPGRTVSVGKGTARSYSCQVSAKLLRNHHDHLEDAKQSLCGKTVVNGIKGYSALHLLNYYDIIRSTPIDYMHAVLLGVVKKLSKLWFVSSNHTKPWYIGRISKLEEIDRKLLQIQLPNTINRNPRSITQRKFWKASEWKSFLFFYIPVVLFCILKDQYYVHAFLLVKAIRILLSCNITENDLQVAQQLLEKFCSGMEMLYGASNCGINVHSLLHLTNFVKLLGPLWTHSAFSFENQMQNLLCHSHATHGIGKQIVESFLLNQKLFCERRKLLDSSSCSTKLQSFLRSFQSTANVDSTVKPIGTGKTHYLQVDDVQRINQLLKMTDSPSLHSNSVRIYHKVEVNGTIFFSQNYTKVTRRNSYTISYCKPSSDNLFYAIVKNYVAASGYYFASIKELEIQCKGPPKEFSKDILNDDSKDVLFGDYLTFQYGTNNYIFVSQILQKLINLSICSWNILTFPVNDVEIE